MPMFIPSPSWNGFTIGSITIHAYALMILLAIVIGSIIGQRRFVSKGGDADDFESMVLFAILGGIIGARIYHVITDYHLYFGPGKNPLDALKIWNGGLGIWGGVAGGALVVWVMCRRMRVSFVTLADSLAPALLIGQAIGRLGNWFNQELYGAPTTLPWGLEIDPQYRPSYFMDQETFHPTFLYEMIWNLIGAGFLLWVEKKFRVGRGKLFALYISFYTFGRFWLEFVRVDPSNHVVGMRINSWVSLVMFLFGIALFLWLEKTRPGYLEPSMQEILDQRALTVAAEKADPADQIAPRVAETAAAPPEDSENSGASATDKLEDVLNIHSVDEKSSAPESSTVLPTDIE